MSNAGTVVGRSQASRYSTPTGIECDQFRSIITDLDGLDHCQEIALEPQRDHEPDCTRAFYVCVTSNHSKPARVTNANVCQGKRRAKADRQRQPRMSKKERGHQVRE